MRPIAVFRFSPTEGPAYFAEWLDARRLPWQLVALDRGDAFPEDARAFSGIGMMGGPMSVNDPLPWRAPLVALLRDAVDAGVPVIGHCLGGQMLAHTLGASVSKTTEPEIGWGVVSVTDDAARRDWFGDRASFTTFQWHYETFELPRAATRVLGSAFAPNQAYVVDGRHIGLQCHVEMNEALVDTWLATGAPELPAESTPARQTAADIRRDLAARVRALHAVADDIYARWATKLAQ